MRKAYIILAHKNEAHIQRMIDRLSDGSSDFFIHVDLKSSFKKERVMFKGNADIRFVKSIRTKWASLDLVQATLNALQVINDTSVNYDRIILLSGQDYPIKNNEQINNYYTQSSYSIFIDHAAFPNYEKWSSGGGMYRVNKYFLGFSWVAKYAARTVNFLSGFFSFLNRKLHQKMAHYHGSQWWTIDNYALQYILSFVKENPAYLAFHRHTFAPDELFFQTILLNAADSRITSRILNDNKMFMKWAQTHSAHPEILCSDDLGEIEHSGALFARKFDGQVDAAILDLIDEKCLLNSVH